MKIQKTSKIIIVFYVFLAIAFAIAMFSINSTFDPYIIPNILPQAIKELEITKQTETDREKIFLIMTDLENYKNIVPKNVKSVNIIEDNGNVVLAEHAITEAGIHTELLVQHTISPYDQHIIEVMEGDAKGTKIVQNFSDEGSMTIIDTTIEFELKGILSPFSYLPYHNLQHAADTLVTSFIDYAKASENETEKILNDFYLEILKRPIDKEGLEHWGSLLESGTLTADEIRIEIENSQEAKTVLHFSEMLTKDEVSDETKKTVNSLYLEILKRPADTRAIEWWGSLLELEKMDYQDVRKNILKSQEALNIKRFDFETVDTIEIIFHEVYEINGLYREVVAGEPTTFYVIDPRIDSQKYSDMLVENEYRVFIEEVTFAELRLEFEELKENGIDFFVDDLESVNEQFLDWNERFVQNKEFYDETDDFCYSCKWGTPFDLTRK